METKLSKIKIQVRRDTQANWLSADPVLLHGELGIVTDQAQLKVGDGTTVFSLLPAYNLNDNGGVAESANKLTTARTINIAGDATGSTQFDGSQDVTITLEVANSATADKLTTPRNINISGDAIGNAAFDGSGDANIVIVVAHADQADTATSATTAGSATSATTAGTANQLSTSRTISLSGDVTGSVNFDGSDNATINATASKLSGSSPITANSSVQEILNWFSTVTA